MTDNETGNKYLTNCIHHQICQGAYNCQTKCQYFEERPQDQWVPVSEGLPEEKLFNPSGSDFGFDFEEVLCTTIWGNVRPYKYGKPIGHDKAHFWLGGGIMDEYVIAWQYKPEPYKETLQNES